MARLLVVEDDTAILEAVAYNLERQGHEVVRAEDGVSALELTRTVEPDLIVLDLMLPRMSGLDVCRVVREERPVPIVVLTARDTEADTVAGLDLGADDYITKPFSMRELLARVGAVLRRDELSRAAGGGPARGRVLSGAGIELSADAREVTRDGEAVALRPKEFELLEYLMRHPGQALSRDTILERVWGYEFGGGTRTVDVHIRWLREKIEADPSSPRSASRPCGGSATSSSREYRALDRPDVRHGRGGGDVCAPPGPGRRDRDHRRDGPARRRAAHGRPPHVAPRRPAAAPHACALRGHPDGTRGTASSTCCRSASRCSTRS